MTFDENGYLIPYELTPSDLSTIEAVFVDPFINSLTRRNVFDAFTSYLTELKSALNAPLEVWVNGSFISLKDNPNDIDFVIFVSKQVATVNSDIIYQFRQRRFSEESLTDGYFVETVPLSHADYNLYQYDRQDWHRAFVFGRNVKKGYLQLLF